MKATEYQKNYMKEYRKKNRTRLNEYARNWRKNNPEKQEAIIQRYWEKKAQEGEQSAKNNESMQG